MVTEFKIQGFSFINTSWFLAVYLLIHKKTHTKKSFNSSVYATTLILSSFLYYTGRPEKNRRTIFEKIIYLMLNRKQLLIV